VNLRLLLTTLAAVVWLATQCDAGSPKRLVLLGQGPDGHPPRTHEYMAGLRILAKCFQEVRGLEITTIRVDAPSRDVEKVLAEADGIVLFLAEGAKWTQQDSQRAEALAKLAARGGGMAGLHWAIGTKQTKPIQPFLNLFGGCHGGADRKYKVLEAVAQVADHKHPIANGISHFKVKDEFYYELKFIQPKGSITPVLQVTIDDRPQTVAWCWERPDGGRSFGFSGLHFHENWGLPEYRRLVAQGVLWTLKLPVPEKGLAVPVAEDDLLLK